MKNRIFSFLLTLTLILTVIPMAVSAADDEAKIGSALYATLGEAITAAKDGETVEVLKNCNFAGMTISKNITVKGADGLDEKPLITLTGSIVPGKDAALTFEGLKFYAKGLNDFSFAETSTGSVLTLKNCNVECSGYYCVNINAHGITLNVEGGNYSSDYSVINFDAKMPQTDKRIIVNVKGATMTETAHVNNQYAVISNNNGKSNVEIHITDSVLNSEAPQDAANGSCIKIGGNTGASNMASNNVLTIRNSTLNSNAQYGIYVERTAKTDITIEDSTLNLNSSMTGGACVKAGGGNGTVENLTLTVKGNLTQLNSKSQYCVYYQGTQNSAIRLEGGKLTVEEAGQSFAWAVSTYKTPENARAKVTVSGAEIDTSKLALDLDTNTDFSITAGKLNEEKSTLSFGGKKQTAQNHPFTNTLYAQYLKGTTAESASTNVRFAIQVPMEGYESYGFLVSAENRILFCALANGGKILSVETDKLYTAVYANGEKIGTDAEGFGWLALGIDGIPKADFGTEFSVRPFAVKNGTVILGETYSFTVNGLLSK
jgi:hypothetical protein